MSRITEIHGDEMREQVIDIIIDALNNQGRPNLTRSSVRSVPQDRSAFIALLDDCRPLPVILELKEDVREGRF
jgi:hypothetical protein